MPPASPEALRQLHARTLTDAGFRRQLQADPRTVLEAAGVALPAGVRVVVHENDEATLHLVLPRLRPNGELGEEQLQQVVGGFALSPFGLPGGTGGPPNPFGGPINVVYW